MTEYIETFLGNIKGPKGDPANVSIKGSYPTLQDLQNDYPEGETGDSWSVGDGTDNRIYVWNEDKEEWQDIGPLSADMTNKADKFERIDKIEYAQGKTFEAIRKNTEYGPNFLITFNNESKDMIHAIRIKSYTIEFIKDYEGLSEDVIDITTTEWITLDELLTHASDLNPKIKYINTDSWTNYPQIELKFADETFGIYNTEDVFNYFKNNELTKEQIENILSNVDLTDYFTKSEIEQMLGDLSNDYNDLINKPDIPKLHIKKSADFKLSELPEGDWGGVV